MVSPKTASLYVLLALFLAALTAGIVLLTADGSGNPGVEILLPTATPTPELRVHISGAITSPGVYELNPGDRLVEALAAAGGATDDARLSCVNLALRVTDEAHYHIPGAEEPCLPGVTAATSAEAEEDGRIDLNAATAEQLETLPGIGEVKAQAIIDYRDNNEGFQSTEELMEVSGIGSRTYETIRDLVYIGRASP